MRVKQTLGIRELEIASSAKYLTGKGVKYYQNPRVRFVTVRMPTKGSNTVSGTIVRSCSLSTRYTVPALLHQETCGQWSALTTGTTRA